MQDCIVNLYKYCLKCPPRAKTKGPTRQMFKANVHAQMSSGHEETCLLNRYPTMKIEQ